MVQKGPFWYSSEMGYRAHRRVSGTEGLTGFAQHKGGSSSRTTSASPSVKVIAPLWDFSRIPVHRCRTFNGSIEGSGVYGSHSGSLLLRVASYGYVPLAARLTHLVFHYTASIRSYPLRQPLRDSSYPASSYSALVSRFNQRPPAGSSA